MAPARRSGKQTVPAAPPSHSRRVSGGPAPVAPMLATPGPLPGGEAWAYEFKWDGMRALAQVAPPAARRARATSGKPRLALLTRSGQDVTGRFPELAGLAQALPEGGILDGEVVALNGRGRPDFGLLQTRMGLTREPDALTRSRRVPVRFFIFDALELGDRDLRALSYRERRAALQALGLRAEAWDVPPYHLDGEAVLDTSRALGLEGVVAKRLDSPYAAGRRSPAWVKVHNRARQEFVVGGWTEGEGSRTGLGAILVGHHAQPGQAGPLLYRGKVGSGFTAADLGRLGRALKAIERPASPFNTAAGRFGGQEGVEERLGDVHFVAPELVVEVEFAGLSSDGLLRQPSFKGIRTDKPAAAVVWEQAEPGTLHAPRPSRPRRGLGLEPHGSAVHEGVAQEA